MNKPDAAKQEPPKLLHKALAELEASNEELRVTEEEMRVQNETLVEAAQALEAERARYRDLFYKSPDPSLLTDLNGLVQEANPAAQVLLNAGPRSLVGKPLAVYVAPDSRRSFRTDLVGGAGEREQALYLQPKRGGLVYATLRVSPVPDVGGTPIGLRWLVRGVTPDPGAELARYRRLMAEVRDFAIFTLDAEGRITGWNAGAEVIFGHASAEVLGQPADIIFTLEDRAEGAPEQEVALAAATGRAEDERWHLRKDGSRLWGSGVMTALRDDVGGPPWYAKIVRDLTERRLHEQREHVVATQLQASVQPAAPLTLPGIAVRSFYRPARRELSVGGDFFDVFGLGDGRSALAVGDVSGKGLEAATQVAMVRNMLRFALYNERGLSDPLTSLNRTLMEHELLSGIVTVFAGIFDPAERTLTYTNCGQEAAQVWRSLTGKVEALRFTGPVLGLDADSHFEEVRVLLSPGDVLVIFTDGLTDIGPSRRDMFGEEGVIGLLQDCIPTLDRASAQRTAELVMRRMVEVVDAQSASDVPDDVCVLVVVAEKQSSA